MLRRRVQQGLGLVLTAFALGVMPAGAGMAQSRAEHTEYETAANERANANVVSVISGQISGTFIQIANEMSMALDDGDRLRVLPIIGLGAEQNLRDVLLLKGVDVGIVRSDGLEALRRDPQLAGRAKSLAYILRLFTDEAHLIAGPGITDIHQLAGKRVNFDLKGSGANFSGRLIFERLGIQVEATNYDQITSYEMLKRGEIAATFQMSGKPISAIAKIGPEQHFHLVSIPFDQKLADLYLPGEFTHDDYPNLVANGSVGTVAVSSILAVYNWNPRTDRYRRVAKFVDALFTKLPDLQKPPRHPKWAEVNLAAEVPGWTRFKPAQDWLDRTGHADAAAGEADTDGPHAAFVRFLAAGGHASASRTERERLFREFVAWQRRQ